MLSTRELHTLLAALRFYQEEGQCEPIKRSIWIELIASNGDQVKPLDAGEINRLCERLNTQHY